MRAERKHVMAVKDYQQRFQELRARRRGGVDDGRVDAGGVGVRVGSEVGIGTTTAGASLVLHFKLSQGSLRLPSPLDEVSILCKFVAFLRFCNRLSYSLQVSYFHRSIQYRRFFGFGVTVWQRATVPRRKMCDPHRLSCTSPAPAARQLCPFDPPPRLLRPNQPCLSLRIRQPPLDTNK